MLTMVVKNELTNLDVRQGTDGQIIMGLLDVEGEWARIFEIGD